MDRIERQAWLRKNALYGPEVTFTNEVVVSYEEPPPSATELQQLASGRPSRRGITPQTKTFQSFVKADITHDFLKNHPLFVLKPQLYPLRWELIRFLQEVVDFDRGSVYFDPKDLRLSHNRQNWLFHGQYFTTVLESDTAPPLVMTLEPAAIELNQTPSALPVLKERWEKIFERARLSGFRGSLVPGGVNGGGHIHMGFSTYQDNLFLKDPLIALDLFRLLHRHSYVLPLLRSIGDEGYESTAVSLFDLDRKLFEYQSFLVNQIYTHTETFAPEHRLRFLKATLKNPSLRPYFWDHDSAISLKNLRRDANPTVEFRFFRAHEDSSDIEAAASVAENLVLDALELPPLDIEGRLHDFDLSNNKLEAPSSEILQRSRQLFERWGLGPELKSRLLSWGGYRIDQDLVTKRVNQKNRSWQPILDGVQIEARPRGNRLIGAMSYRIKLPWNLIDQKLGSSSLRILGLAKGLVLPPATDLEASELVVDITPSAFVTKQDWLLIWVTEAENLILHISASQDENSTLFHNFRVRVLKDMPGHQDLKRIYPNRDLYSQYQNSSSEFWEGLKNQGICTDGFFALQSDLVEASRFDLELSASNSITAKSLLMADRLEVNGVPTEFEVMQEYWLFHILVKDLRLWDKFEDLKLHFFRGSELLYSVTYPGSKRDRPLHSPYN
jgi:hypothetical protein